ncbi:MAG: TIGR02221 family CRISPR-associated protein [Deltaproteobacteria bacterium]|nr:TIGR02221 family CRISPR-associated protein [Deltaproteobacteria bacterium]
MSKIYISFLGTNDYIPCIYYKENQDFECKDVRFIQEATIRFACSDWSSSDRILIFTTQEAYMKNWMNDGHVDRKTKRHLNRTGLKECISRLNLPCPMIRIQIPEGKSVEEIWEIFGKVYENLNQDDEVIFDITHAFRSIPMLAIVILNYAKVMKHITLGGVYYGAFEVLGSLDEAKRKPLEERRVPILDLTAFDQLLDWTVAVDRFTKAGDAGLIKPLAERGLKRLLAESKGKDLNATTIRGIGRTLESFCTSMATCRSELISPIGSRLKSLIEKCENAGLLPPFQPLFRLLREEIEPFNGEELSDGIAAAEWCFERNLIQQSATILREVVITYLVSHMQGNAKDSTERKIAAAAINIAFNRIRGRESEKDIQENIRERIQAYHQICDQKPELVKIWGPLAKLRNDLNHAGYVRDPKVPSGFSKELPKLIARVQSEIR